MSAAASFTLLAVVSADGFIARWPGDHPGSWASAEDQAWFLEEIPRFDWSFMGRVTHETAWRADRRRVIFSRGARGLEWREPTHLWVDPEKHELAAILAELAGVREPRDCAVLGGTTVHDWFLDRGLLDRVDLSIETRRLGGGLPLLTGLPPGDPTGALARHGFVVVDRQQLGDRGVRLLSLLRPR